MRLIVGFCRYLERVLHRRFCTGCMLKTDSQFTGNHTGGGKNEGKDDRVLPPEPTNCCNSGCPNCVWIKYAQELAQLYDDGDVLAKKKINEKVKDQTLKAFLLTQLGLKENEKRP